MEVCDSHGEMMLKAGTSMESLGLKGDDDERDEFVVRDEDEEVESKATAIMFAPCIYAYIYPVVK